MSSREKKNFWNQTSIPGISHAHARVDSGAGRNRRLVWLCFFTVGLLLTIIQVIQVCQDYLKYPVTTKIEVSDIGMLPFPAVSVCPVNRLKCSALVEVLDECMTGQMDCGDGKKHTYCEISFHAGCLRWLLRDAENRTATSERLLQMCPDHNANAVPWNSLEAEMGAIHEATLDEEYSSLLPSERQRIGMDHKELVKDCMVSGAHHCSEFFNVTVINTVARGNCFTFNGEGSLGKVMPGPENGLNIIFFLDRDQYPWRPANDLEGLRVVLHSPTEIPLPEEKGLDVQPGTATRISIEREQLIRQPDPYPSKCLQEWSETTLRDEVTTVLQNEDYVQATCSRYCLMVHMVNKCDCLWHKYDDLNLREAKIEMNAHPQWFCSFINETQQKCLEDNIGSFDREDCDCGPACKDVSYKASSVSSLKWPSEASWAYKAHQFNIDVLKEEVTADHLKLEGEERFVSAADVRANLIKLDIFFAKSTETIIEEVPMYPGFYSLFTSLGGAMSVWMGVSFIMIVEVAELVIDVMSTSVCKNRQSQLTNRN